MVQLCHLIAFLCLGGPGFSKHTVTNDVSLRLTLAKSLSSLLISFISLLAASVLPISYCAYALHRKARALVVGEVWKNRANFAHFSADTKSFSLRRVLPCSVHFNDSF